MCLRPVHIFNQTRDFHPFDCASYLVPCGCCEECVQQRINDYQFRIYAQMLYDRSRGWRNYFLTLTYNNEHLPHLPFKDSRGQSIACFSKSDVEDFVDYIQKTLWRKHKKDLLNVLRKDDKGNYEPFLHYLIACEYGGKYARPHMHLHLSCPDVIHPFTLHSICDKAWSEVARDEDGNII